MLYYAIQYYTNTNTIAYHTILMCCNVATERSVAVSCPVMCVALTNAPKFHVYGGH